MTTTKTRRTPSTLTPVGNDEMKNVAGGEVGAVMAAMRAGCAEIGFECDGAICLSNYYYTGKNRCY